MVGQAIMCTGSGSFSTALFFLFPAIQNALCVVWACVCLLPNQLTHSFCNILAQTMRCSIASLNSSLCIHLPLSFRGLRGKFLCLPSRPNKPHIFLLTQYRDTRCIRPCWKT
jgi:hypothetical protein